MTSFNVTPATPAALPYTYTDNFGQVYQFAALSKQGCVDTVYSETYNGNAYNPSTVVNGQTALALIADANHQFGTVFTACQSLIDQVPASSASSASVTSIDLFPSIGLNNWILDDVAGLSIGLLMIGVAFWAAGEFGLVKKRR